MAWCTRGKQVGKFVATDAVQQRDGADDNENNNDNSSSDEREWSVDELMRRMTRLK